MRMTHGPIWAPETEGTGAAEAVVEASNPSPASPDPAPAAVSADTPKLATEAPKPEAPKTPPSDAWKDQRIASLTARLNAERAKNAQPQGEAPKAPLDPTADFDSRVREAAVQQATVMTAQAQFNRDCNSAAEAGRDKFGKEKFNASVSALQTLMDPTDGGSVAAYNEFLLAALETGDAPTLLYELGQDMGEAQRILSLPPLKRVVELTKRVAKAPSTEVSNLPKPITPVDSVGSRHVDIAPSDPRGDELPTDVWMARREAEIKAKAAR